MEKSQEILFEVKDAFGVHVRTTKNYWDKILRDKHTELKTTKYEVMETIHAPNEVFQSIQDPYIKLFYKRFKNLYLVIVVKYIDSQGFVVTAYKTSKVKRKGKLLWQNKT